MKFLAQVNKIKNPVESEIEEAKRKDPNSDFVLAFFPDYNQETGKLLGIKEVLCQITVLGDPNNFFYNGGFGCENKPLCSTCRRQKFRNPFSCTVPSFLKRPMKEASLDTIKQSEIFCITLSNQRRSKVQRQPFVCFIIVNEAVLVMEFTLFSLLNEDASQRCYARNYVRNVAKLIVESNKKHIVTI